MQKNDAWTRILAIAGALLAWFPIIAPVLFSVLALIGSRRFRLDWLMPAELFLFALVGGGLLLWASIRARSRRALIAGGLGGAVVLLVGGQALAVATGLASGETEPTGLPWALVVASLGLYIAALVAVGIGGALLLRDLFVAPKAQPSA